MVRQFFDRKYFAFTFPNILILSQFYYLKKKNISYFNILNVDHSPLINFYNKKTSVPMKLFRMRYQSRFQIFSWHISIETISNKFRFCSISITLDENEIIW